MFPNSALNFSLSSSCACGGRPPMKKPNTSKSIACIAARNILSNARSFVTPENKHLIAFTVNSLRLHIDSRERMSFRESLSSFLIHFPLNFPSFSYFSQSTKEDNRVSLFFKSSIAIFAAFFVYGCDFAFFLAFFATAFLAIRSCFFKILLPSSWSITVRL